jgi:hypothetical protein
MDFQLDPKWRLCISIFIKSHTVNNYNRVIKCPMLIFPLESLENTITIANLTLRDERLYISGVLYKLT